MIKAAIFDVDGTLFDSMPFWMNAGTNFLQSLGNTTTEDLGNVLLSMSLEEGAEYLVKNYLPNMTASEVLGGIVDVMNNAYKNLIPLKKGAKNLLKKFFLFIRLFNKPFSWTRISTKFITKFTAKKRI